MNLKKMRLRNSLIWRTSIIWYTHIISFIQTCYSMYFDMINSNIIMKLIEIACVYGVSLITVWFQLLLSSLTHFMSSSREHPICCCCPKRAETHGTYKTIGSDTIKKIQPHAHCAIIKDETRACNKCYKKYTRPPKNKVIPSSGPTFMHHIILYILTYTKYAHNCMDRCLGMCSFLCKHTCYRTHLSPNSIHLLMWLLIFNMIMIKMMTWRWNIMIR